MHIPEVISRYIGSSIMPTAVITDYIRVSLLASYGGLWLDATILVSSPIEEYYFSKQFYTLHTPYEHSPYVSNNRIHCYVLGGEKNSPVFKYVQNAFEEYWSRFDFLINYYLIDYIIMYGYWNSSAIREYIDGLEYTSTTLYEIYSLLDKPLDESRIMRLLQENKFSKLSWKGNLSCNPDSNYAFLNKLYF